MYDQLPTIFTQIILQAVLHSHILFHPYLFSVTVYQTAVLIVHLRRATQRSTIIFSIKNRAY